MLIDTETRGADPGADAGEPIEVTPKRRYRFAELLSDPPVKERWERVRRWFFLRESTYDVSNRCNLQCDGCYYYEGEKQFAPENRDPEKWRELMRAEKERGITYTVLAGAEPALLPAVCQACSDEIPLGCIATNGVKRIPDSVGYKIHISVWGNDETSHTVRRAPRLLQRQMDNYAGDDRAVFVVTFTRQNIDEVAEVVDHLASKGCRVTFNMFSAPVGYAGELRHTPQTLRQTRRAMLSLLRRYPEQVLYSPYNAVAHTHDQGLHSLYRCSYPRCNPSQHVGLGRSFRQYRTDHSWDRSAACCVPDTDCEDCRHYASGSAVVTARLHRHAIHPLLFRSWLDYVDTYLAVWVMGYDKGPNLCNQLVAPPRGEPAPAGTPPAAEPETTP
jgi:MoaA/NifB/PqqE/SkfB family radical SAM enzyme